MEPLLTKLAKTARSEQAVARQKLEDGISLIVYPLNRGMIVGFSLEAEDSSPVKAEEMLRKRSTNLSRYGDWLPAMFADGSCHVFRRLLNADPDSQDSLPTEEELLLGRELLV